MRLPTSDHPHQNLLAQQEFTVNDAANFITIKSGRDLETGAKYRQELLDSIKGTLVPDIDTSVFKGIQIHGNFTMKRNEGERLFSIQSIEKWIVQNSIEVAEEFQLTFWGKQWASKMWISSYLTINALDNLSRKASLTMEEVVQIIHLRTHTKKYMPNEMLDTWDTINRHLAASGEALKKDQQIRSANILTIAACLSYPIPCQLVKWLKKIPIEGVNWTSKPLDTGVKIGEPEKRVRVLRDVVSEMLTKGVFSENDPRWPRTKIWQQAVKFNPKLFPDDPNDQKEGVFAKAYNIVKSKFS